MPLEFKDGSDGYLIEIKASGRLKADDYRMFLRKFEPTVQGEEKKRSLLFVMEDFHGWDVGALWQDLKFDIKHFNAFERVALVGDKKWERWMGELYGPFTAADVRYFKLDKLELAREWARHGPVETESGPESSEKESQHR